MWRDPLTWLRILAKLRISVDPGSDRAGAVTGANKTDRGPLMQCRGGLGVAWGPANLAGFGLGSG
jgi:hypothetical protein